MALMNVYLVLVHVTNPTRCVLKFAAVGVAAPSTRSSMRMARSVLILVPVPEIVSCIWASTYSWLVDARDSLSP